MSRDNLSGQLRSLPSCIRINYSTLFTICVVKKSAPQFDPRYAPVSEAEPTSPRLVTSTFKCKRPPEVRAFLTSVRFLEPAFRPFPDLASCRQALEYALMLTDGPAVLVAGIHVGNRFNLARSRAICSASRPWHLRCSAAGKRVASRAKTARATCSGSMPGSRSGLSRMRYDSWRPSVGQGASPRSTNRAGAAAIARPDRLPHSPRSNRAHHAMLQARLYKLDPGRANRDLARDH